MNDSEKMLLLVDWQQHIQLYNTHVDTINKLFGCDGEILENIDQMIVSYTNILSALIGDNKDWLFWFWLENDFGVNKLTAELHNQTIIVDNLSVLLQVINYSSIQ